MKKYIKEHKIVVAAVIFMLIIIILCFIGKQLFFSNGDNAVYGDRLDGIEAVEVNNKQQKEIISNLKKDTTVKKVTYKLQGKIINIVITVNDDVGIATAKGLGTKVLEKLEDDQKKYYDIQVFVKKDTETKDFPIIGYKQNNKESFSWTKDRSAE